MNRHPSMRSPLWLAALLALSSAPALAQYKVIGPDGRVTYTDRPPSDSTSRVVSIGRREVAASAPAGAAAAPLPLELRQVASRFPVQLYAGNDCPPCEQGRRWLQQRGVPYAEKQVASEDDSAALERLVGGRTIPSITIGAQALRGFAPADWAAYLDAAGYPKESRLPASWQPPVATPLVERNRATPVVAAPPPASPPRAAAPRPAPRPESDDIEPPPETAIRF